MYMKSLIFSHNSCYILNAKINSWQISPMILIIPTQVSSIKIQEYIIQEIKYMIAGISSTNMGNLNFILCVSSQHSDYA